MAKSEKDSQSSIDSILRNLTERPNVQLTLILSRKDGSIIKTAGFASADKRRRAQSTAGYRTNEVAQQQRVNSQEEVSTSQESPENGSKVQAVSAAEELASAIFHFMQAAAAMGGTLEDVSSEGNPDDVGFLKGSSEHEGKTEVNEPERTASSVQLLRLRIKHREIIIFPDPQYLCCVVQRIGKQQGATEAR